MIQETVDTRRGCGSGKFQIPARTTFSDIFENVKVPPITPNGIAVGFAQAAPSAGAPGTASAAKSHFNHAFVDRRQPATRKYTNFGRVHAPTAGRLDYRLD